MYIALEAGIGLGAVASGWLLNHIMGKAGMDASFGLSALLALGATVYLGWLWRKSAGVAEEPQRTDSLAEESS